MSALPGPRRLKTSPLWNLYKTEPTDDSNHYLQCFRQLCPHHLTGMIDDTGVPGSHPNIVLGMLGRMELRTPSIPKSHPKSFGQGKRNTNVDRMKS